MKKIIKIFTLAICIIMFFGITTSKALTVKETTTAKAMLEALNSGDTLTGLTSSIKNANPYLYCRNGNVYLSNTAKYNFELTDEDKSITYDTTQELNDNSYAKAYILGASGYEKYEDRQWAWWQLLNQKTGENNLLKAARDYQDFKYQENDIEMELGDANGDAKTTISGNNVCYGPIKIKYSYTKGTRSGIIFGGFNYVVFNSKGENITEQVQLCKKNSDNTYTKVSASKNSNGYYEVRTSDYNNTELYLVTTNKNIDRVNLKIQENKEDYKATIYEIKGKYKYNYSHVIYCDACQVEQDKYKLYKNDSQYGFYIYQATKTEQNSKYTYNYNYFYNSMNGNEYREKVASQNGYPQTNTSYTCNVCNDSNLRLITEDTAKNHATNKHYDSDNSRCYKCGLGPYETKDSFWAHFKDKHMTSKTYNTVKKYVYDIYEGCGKEDCGIIRDAGINYNSQPLFIVDTNTSTKSNEIKLDINVQLSTSIEITKTWEDYNNEYNLRPESLKFNVFRSTDKANWTKLSENTDYTVAITKKDNTWTIVISDLLRCDSTGNKYYFKVEEQEQTYYEATYPNGTTPIENLTTGIWSMSITNKLRKINLGGYVWLDGQTGIKPAVEPNGKMDTSETKLQGIAVYLYYKNPTTVNGGETQIVGLTKTDENGYYEFENKEIGYYYVKFEYDGINYEDTIKVEEPKDNEIVSKAFENNDKRNDFNSRFQTITYGQSNDGTKLEYNYSDGKSTLVTKTAGGSVNSKFVMYATTEEKLYTTGPKDLNLGLIKRGVDIALSTDVADAEVTINGQETIYKYNTADNTIEISNKQSSEVTYNLNLYTSDYYYRIRDYANQHGFHNENTETSGAKTGDELKVSVKYELNLQNQSTETVRVNEVKYVFDEKYTFTKITDESYATSVSGNTITINLNGLELKDGETKTLYLLFNVNNNNELSIENPLNFSNKAEITSYSTDKDKGLIDIDSQPGNFINGGQVEDDSDTAGGLKIKLADEYERKITGKVFDEDGKNVNDVIVQLIELKTVNEKVYEYIWQETVSGTGKGKRLTAGGQETEDYKYTIADGYYEFKGMIPGDYIVRFIYGDGTTYDMTENVIKYNGQDYKSMTDSNYKEEWYNSSTYTAGASVARDNEARRLETMAYSVNIDAEKGVLLKLLDNVELNETEKETVIAVYNKLYDSDITEVTTDVINKLLKEQTLKNTWMCAETSKIKVAVDTEDITNTKITTSVNGMKKTYVNEISNINLGLEIRPVTKIELKKYITGFKLVASNGQTLVNAYIDVNEYLANPTDISNKVQGIKDNVTILDTVWQYEVAPTDINTIVDGASLEFEYTLVVKNTSDTDYLSNELIGAYKDNSIEEYANILTDKSSEMKGYMKAGTYKDNIGKYIGSKYYTEKTEGATVLTEITNIRDYINNDLTFVTSSGDVAVDENAPHTYRILRDDYSMQTATINTVLKTTKTTGKLSNDGNAVIYKVTLGKNPISSTGNLNFENYIAEVMSFTNSAGRRSMTSTPGNAEIIDHEYRTGKTHEIDEADTARIQIGASTGEDEKTNYIIVIAVAGALMVIAVGAVLVKKYVIK